MTYYSSQDIDNLDQRFRALLINSLSGFKSANLIGTIDSSGQENLSIVSSVFHLGAHPPLLGMIIRPHSVPRHTFENILETGEYTINHVNESIWQQAHQTSARYERTQSEFAETGLTPEYKSDCIAPFVKESNVQIAMKLRETQTIALNQTELVIGEIVGLHVDSGAIADDGYLDINSLGTVALSSLDGYHTCNPLDRLAYAKPNTEPKTLK